MIVPGRGRQHLEGLAKAALGEQRLGQLLAAHGVERAGPVQDQPHPRHGLQIVQSPGPLEIGLQRPVGLQPAFVGRRRAPPGDIVGPGPFEAGHPAVGQGRAPEARDLQPQAHGASRLRMISSSRVRPTGNWYSPTCSKPWRA